MQRVVREVRRVKLAEEKIRSGEKSWMTNEERRERGEREMIGAGEEKRESTTLSPFKCGSY